VDQRLADVLEDARGAATLIAEELHNAHQELNSAVGGRAM